MALPYFFDTHHFAICEHDLSPEGPKQGATLYTHGVWHSQQKTVAFGSSHVRQADACVATCRLHLQAGRCACVFVCVVNCEGGRGLMCARVFARVCAHV
jgi:hypothetical protein